MSGRASGIKPHVISNTVCGPRDLLWQTWEQGAAKSKKECYLVSPSRALKQNLNTQDNHAQTMWKPCTEWMGSLLSLVFHKVSFSCHLWEIFLVTTAPDLLIRKKKKLFCFNCLSGSLQSVFLTMSIVKIGI